MKQHIPLRNTFRKYLKGQLSESEAKDFLMYIKTGQDEELLKELVNETLADSVEEALLKESELIRILDESWIHIQDHIQERSTFRLNRWKWMTAIAALFLATVFIGLWYYQKETVRATDHPAQQDKIIPGRETATLTLANGKKIRLMDTQDGTLEEEAGVRISKSLDGKLIYEIIDGHIASSGYNTLSTTRGETYRVQLPDGTQVWLNAASTIKYAVNFKAQPQRRVELEGEAYFEVAKDKEHPFIVTTNNQEVEVLGTRFNINNYTDETAAQTTLLEGSVQINHQGKKTALQPGQQANLSATGALRVRTVDTDPIISWVNNEFMFDGDDIETVMRKIARWYNVEIIYIGAKTKEKFGGGLSRFEDVAQVLGLLEKTGAVKFKVEGKIIYVQST